MKVRLLGSEHRMWKAAAGKRKMKLAAWVREACERHLAYEFKIVTPTIEQGAEAAPAPPPATGI